MNWLDEPEVIRMNYDYDSYLLDDKDENISALQAMKTPFEDAVGFSYMKGLYNKVHKDKYTVLQSFSGRHRSGKSIGATVEGYILDETFWENRATRIVRDSSGFFDCIEWIQKTGTEGAYILIDESGVSMASADWAEMWARDLTKAMQMLGWLLPIISFASPARDFTMSKVRRLIHIHNDVIRPSTTHSYILPYDIKRSELSGKEYTPHPHATLFGQSYCISRIKIDKPPEWLIDGYTEIAEPTKKDVMKNFISRSRPEQKKIDEPLDLEKVAEIVAHSPEQFRRMSTKRFFLSDDLIQYKFADKTQNKKLSAKETRTIKERAMQIIYEKEKIKKEK